MASDFFYPLIFVSLMFILAGLLLRLWHRADNSDSRASGLASTNGSETNEKR